MIIYKEKTLFSIMEKWKTLYKMYIKFDKTRINFKFNFSFEFFLIIVFSSFSKYLHHNRTLSKFACFSFFRKNDLTQDWLWYLFTTIHSKNSMDIPFCLVQHLWAVIISVTTYPLTIFSMFLLYCLSFSISKNIDIPFLCLSIAKRQI